MMKCLSVRQPWASLIIRGVKPVENRTWDTGYRGRLAIHASKTRETKADMYREDWARIVEAFEYGGEWEQRPDGYAEPKSLGYCNHYEIDLPHSLTACDRWEAADD